MRDLIPSTSLPVTFVVFAGMLVFSWLTIAFSQNVNSTSRKDDIIIKIPKAPTIMHTTVGRVLAYEFYITRRGSTEAPLPTSIKVFKDKEDVAILTLTADTLAAAIAKPRDVLDANFLSPSGRTVVYMWVPLIEDDTPRNLRHRLTFSSSSGEIDAGAISIGKEILVIGPPVRGDNWLVGNGPSNEAGHRRFIAFSKDLGLGPNLSQRFAIIAVANARVVAVKDGLPENTPRSGSLAVTVNRDTGSGNRVVLDLGNGRFASYGHLQPGSIRVKVGDKVKRGLPLAKIGNSGLSSGPHLHFQLMDTPDVLFAEGLPYVFDRFTLLGTCDDKTCFPSEPRTIKRQIPVSLLLVSFQNR